jgi:spermidine/putrescine transport system permease protein
MAAALRIGKGQLLAAPMYAWIGLLVLAPNVLLILYSLWRNDLGAVQQVWSLDNYTRALESEVVRTAMVRTLMISLGAAALATVIAFPLAYLVVRRFGRWKLAAALLVLVPLWISLLMRVFSWRIILGEDGVLNSFLMNSGVTSTPSSAFLYSTPAVILVLTYVAVPYVFLTVFVMLDRIPANLFEASGDCGAAPWRTMVHVVWPLSRPAVVTGFGIGFILAFGDYVSPTLVGGLKGTMVGSLVVQQFGLGNDWPYGSALAMTIVLVSLVFMAIISLGARLEARYE